MTTKWKRRGTQVAATAWIAVCAYLHVAWPSLGALLETLPMPPAMQWLPGVPRSAFLALGALALLGLTIKDRWLRAPLALAVDAVIGAPAFAVIAFLLEPFLISVE